MSNKVAPVLDGGQQEAEELRQPSPAPAAAEATEVGSGTLASSSAISASEAAATSAAVEQEIIVAENYSDRKYLLQTIKQKNVQLVSPQLFIDYHKAGKPLPKCQDVPSKYVLDPDALTEEQWEVLEVIAISYCWISPDHPDPNGYYLEVLAKLLSLFVEGKFEEGKEYDMNDGESTLADYLRDLGFHFGAFDGRPVGIFLDWPSVPQDKPHGSRTEAETVVFKDALTCGMAHNAPDRRVLYNADVALEYDNAEDDVVAAASPRPATPGLDLDTLHAEDASDSE